jgi:hypothetical protein
MAKIELMVDSHLIDTGVQIHGLAFLENVGRMGGFFNDLCDETINIFKDRLDVLFPFLFEFLKETRRRRRSHFILTYNHKKIKINS